jgi:hypothetical protein
MILLGGTTHGYNTRHGTAFAYYDRGADPPDLIYCDGSQEMLIEVTAAYYNTDHAKMNWQNARGVAGALGMCIIQSPGQELIAHINAGLAKKCDKPYPANCTLVLQLYPDLIAAEELDASISQIRVPRDHPFEHIYLAGIFPMTIGSQSGYRCWKLA